MSKKNPKKNAPKTASPPQPEANAVQRLILPVQEFIQNQVTGGFLLIAATILAMVVANSAWAHSYHHFWETPVNFGFGAFELKKTLHHWINDGLMTLFFVLVGLEIKRELLEGELSSVQKALLPIIAAAGGMLLPAGIYYLFNFSNPNTAGGWGIPMATDIAFSLMILSLLGPKVPASIRIFLAALAIADDLGGIVVIAVFYTSGFQLGMLVVGLLLLAFLFVLNGIGVRSLWPYSLVGLLMWYCFLMSGVHPTIAGVCLAFSIPMRPRGTWAESQARLQEVRELANELITDGETKKREGLYSDQIIERLQNTTWTLESPLQNMIHALHPVSSFVVMPIFAFANAGITLEASALANLFSGVGLGVILGLTLGKSLGITGLSWLACKMKIAKLPEGVTWKHIYGTGWVAGIGFTVALFIAGLSFPKSPESLDAAKMAVLVGSILSGAGGYFILNAKSKKNAKTDKLTFANAAALQTGQQPETEKL